LFELNNRQNTHQKSICLIWLTVAMPPAMRLEIDALSLLSLTEITLGEAYHACPVSVLIHYLFRHHFHDKVYPQGDQDTGRIIIESKEGQTQHTTFGLLCFKDLEIFIQ
jgi:hypothetical protein